MKLKSTEFAQKPKSKELIWGTGQERKNHRTEEDHGSKCIQTWAVIHLIHPWTTLVEDLDTIVFMWDKAELADMTTLVNFGRLCNVSMRLYS